jgi:glycerol uptake facilitator-like aquaporin
MSVKNPELMAEFLGSMFLTMAAITPMILFPNILESSIGLAVIADGLVVAFVLFALIEMFGAISGAHFNPVVSITMRILGRMPTEKTVLYITTQIIGGLTGLLATHGMFFHQIPKLIEVSSNQRSGGAYLGEIFGTFILLLSILLLVQQENPRIAPVIGFLVGGQLMATSSTMFANPMITLVRIFTYSAAGIQPLDSLVFIMMQMIGMVLAVFVWRELSK